MSSEKVDIVLYVKASTYDKELHGSCPLSQKWFMAYYIIMMNGQLSMRVLPVSLDSQPEEYTKLDISRRLPAVFVLSGADSETNEDLTGNVYSTEEELEEFMIKMRCPNMVLESSAFGVTVNLYRNFNLYLVAGKSEALERDLNALNDFMQERGVPYLSGYDISYVDCHMMPKLQHIRVACSILKDFEISTKLKYVWKYFATMYETEAFKRSCPKDRDIITHYFHKVYPPASKNINPVNLVKCEMTNTIPLVLDDEPEND